MCEEKCTPDQRISEYPFKECHSFYVVDTVWCLLNILLIWIELEEKLNMQPSQFVQAAIILHYVYKQSLRLMSLWLALYFLYTKDVWYKELVQIILIHPVVCDIIRFHFNILKLLFPVYILYITNTHTRYTASAQESFR